MRLLPLRIAFAAAASYPAAVDGGTNSVVDLSLPEFASSPLRNTNPGAIAVNELAENSPQVRSVLVLENGQIVADYVREDVNVEIPYPVWSTTKTWMSVAIGLMIQDGQLRIDESLDEIFDEEMWQTIKDADFRREVTIEQLLTMTSGLRTQSPVVSDEDTIWSDGENLGTLGGANLAGAIQEPMVFRSKSFSYLPANNILSYVIAQRTNYSTPRDYFAANILPSLGISNEQIDWWQNQDGIEYSYHGLLMTSTQMAKLGQLHLQGGKSNTTHQLINQEWAKSSISVQGGNIFYGYLWWVYRGQMFEKPQVGIFSCSQGLGGQDICVSPDTSRVFVQQRDLTKAVETELDGRMDIALLAFEPDLVFADQEGIADEEFVDLETENQGDPTSEVMSAAPSSWALHDVAVSHVVLFWISSTLIVLGGLM